MTVTAKVLAELAHPVPPLLYHYTSARGLLGILESHRLWASDTRFLNDLTEATHGAALCRDELKLANYDGPFGQMCGRLLEHLAVEKFLHFTVSFCEAPDLVPQWRGYAAGGAGYAIGVAAARLVSNPDDVSLLRVRYRDDEKRSAIRALLDAHWTAWQQVEARSREEQKRAIGDLGLSVLSGLTLLSLSFKAEVFEYEREWRLVDSVSPEHPDQMVGVKFRDSNSSIVPYVEFSLLVDGEQLAESPIQEIWIGPIHQNAETRNVVRTLCALRGMQTQVNVSSAPLRF